jgi:hypothetical protein
MSDHNRPRQPFDESVAEAALEGIRRELDESRQRRKQANEAFDAFLRSFGPRTGRDSQPVSARSPDLHSRSRAAEPAAAPVAAPPPRAQAGPVGVRDGERHEYSAPPPNAGTLPAAPVIVEPRPGESQPPDPADLPAVVVIPPPSVGVAPTQRTPGPAVREPAPSSPPGTAERSAPPQPPAVVLIPPAAALPPDQAVLPPRDPHRRELTTTGPQPSVQIIQDRGEFDTLIPETPQPTDPRASVPRVSQPAVPAGLGAMLRRPRVQPGYVAIAVLLVAAVAAMFAWSRDEEPPAASTAPTAAAASPPAPQAVAPPAAPVNGVQIELTTLRRVWMRVVVDGEKTIEREIDAGQRIPVTATQSIVVRAGDAGAVRISAGGKEEIFGTEGLPATRSFTRPR